MHSTNRNIGSDTACKETRPRTSQEDMPLFRTTRRIAAILVIAGVLAAPVFSYYIAERARADGGGPAGAAAPGQDTGLTPAAPSGTAARPPTTTPQTAAAAMPGWLWIAIPIALVAIGITAWQIGKSPGRPA